MQAHEIIIDERFRCILPTLDKETYRLLEESLLEHGCQDPLVTWNNTLIDGFNRYRICTEHNIPFTVVEIEFNSREEALIWIITYQVARRNLTPVQLSHFRGLHYRAERALVTNERGINQYNKKQEVEPQNEGQPKNLSTATRLARKYRVSRATIERDSNASRGIEAIGEVSPEAMRMILAGEVDINKKILMSLAYMTPKELEEIVAEIENGTYEKRALAALAPDPASTPSSAQADDPGNSANSSSSDYFTYHESDEIRHFASAISGIASGYQSVMQKYNNGDLVELKSTLRVYIDSLEDLYSSI